MNERTRKQVTRHARTQKYTLMGKINEKTKLLSEHLRNVLGTVDFSSASKSASGQRKSQRRRNKKSPVADENKEVLFRFRSGASKKSSPRLSTLSFSTSTRAIQKSSKLRKQGRDKGHTQIKKCFILPPVIFGAE